jgi:hypothetical protein
LSLGKPFGLIRKGPLLQPVNVAAPDATRPAAQR